MEGKGMEAEAKPKKLFYGWIVLACALIMVVVTTGIVSNSYSIFTIPIAEDLSISHADMGLNFTILKIGTVAVALFGSAIFSRFKMKPLMLIGAAVLIACYVLTSFVRSKILLHLLTAVLGMALGLVGLYPFSIIVHNWFHSHIGLALGIMMMGTGIGGAIFSPVGTALIHAVGWRFTYRIFAALMAAVVFPALIWIIRVRPEDMGLRPMGEETVKEAVPLYGPSMHHVLHMPRFYLMMLGLFMFGLTHTFAISGATPQITATLGASTAGVVASGYMISLAVGKIIIGWLYDRIGPRWATMVGMVSLALGLFSLTLIGKSSVFLITYVVFCGIGSTLGTVPNNIFTENGFGTRNYVTISGIFTAANSGGSMVTPPLAGAIYDSMGTYNPGFVLGTVLVLAVMIPTFIAIPSRKRVEKEREEALHEAHKVALHD